MYESAVAVNQRNIVAIKHFCSLIVLVGGLHHQQPKTLWWWHSSYSSAPSERIFMLISRSWLLLFGKGRIWRVHINGRHIIMRTRKFNVMVAIKRIITLCQPRCQRLWSNMMKHKFRFVVAIARVNDLNRNIVIWVHDSELGTSRQKYIK